MRHFIISLILMFTCNSAFALDTEDADAFGNSFISALQNGKSINFIPNRFHTDTFLYSTFGEEYLNLTPTEQAEAQTSLNNALQFLHSTPLLSILYQRLEFLDTKLESVGEDYIYTFISQLPGENADEDSIYLKKINGQFYIVDIKNNNGWMVEFTRDIYQDIEGELSIPELMQLMEYKFRQEYGG